jgi:hypothetical protein
MMDGLKLFLQASENSDIQERYYNGWTHDHYVTSVFCFVPMGQFQLPFLTSLDAFMTVRWQRWVRFIRSWGKSMRKQATNAASTSRLGMGTGSTFINCVKTCWDLRLLPELRGKWNCKKEERRHRQGRQPSGGC